ncbi:MAG: sigma-70 family RNA polymerase sigma factor, partial [Planctomycetes bacterium]|nr:sigma-70 family RNA polymerase sigma factor [Planctomycetota bacterium]
EASTRASLLSRVRSLEDHAAWHEFDCQYRDLILRYCRRHGLQAADAEDVRQMVMLNLARQLRGFKYRPQMGRFRNYLGTTVRNAIHRLFRSPRREFAGLEVDDLHSDETAEFLADDVWETEWMHHHYRLALGKLKLQLPGRSMETFERLMQGATAVEVAAAMDSTVAAVHKVKQRVRNRLQELVAEQIRQEDGVDAA